MKLFSATLALALSSLVTFGAASEEATRRVSKILSPISCGLCCFGCVTVFVEVWLKIDYYFRYDIIIIIIVVNVFDICIMLSNSKLAFGSLLVYQRCLGSWKLLFYLTILFLLTYSFKISIDQYLR